VPTSLSPRALWRMRLGAVMASAVVLVSAAGCATSPSDGAAPPSTFGADSPWLGSFTPEDLPPPVNSLTDLYCADASRCWAVGSTVGTAGAPNGAAIIATTDGGARWVDQPVPPTVGYLSGVACTTTRDCTAVGQAAQPSDGQAAIIVTSDGGAAWTQIPTPPDLLDATAVTCHTDRVCLAMGTTAGAEVTLVSSSSGQTWTQAGTLPANMSGASAISCSDDQTCWVTAHTVLGLDQVAGSVALTTDGGATWAPVATPTGLGILNSVSCTAGATTGAGAFPTTTTTPTTTTGSSTSSTASPTTAAPPPVSSTTVPPAPVVGVPGARCTVVGTTATSLTAVRSGHGVILTTDNGGADWTSQSVTPSAASLMDVSCPAIGSCVAVGSSVATVPEAGLVILTGAPSNPWKRPAVVGSPQALSAVSCLSDSQCIAVGESISEYLSGG
jgi:photosystem II stability/assembly factor-like uncharacterized protein